MKRVLLFLLVLLMAPSAWAENYTVQEVIDAATIKLNKGRIVRLIGVELPEEDAARQEAKDFVKYLVQEGQPVLLEFDVKEKDREGVLLAYLYLDYGRPRNAHLMLKYAKGLSYANYQGRSCLFLNASIIGMGHARPSALPPNDKYSDLFKRISQTAKENKRGMWSDFVSYADFAGEWDSIDRPENESFYLKLEQEDDVIRGSYCAIAFGGSKVDCGFEEGVCAVSGTAKGNVAEIKFKSCFGGKEGTAKLVHKGEYIEWGITRPPVGRWYFCPAKATLEKRIKIWKRPDNE